MANTTVREITVNKDDLVKAVEFAVSSACSRKESWMYFDGVYCMDFYSQDERPGVNDVSGYEEWLKLGGLVDDEGDIIDTDENYGLFIQSLKDYYSSVALDKVLVLNSDEEIEEEIEVTYI